MYVNFFAFINNLFMGDKGSRNLGIVKQIFWISFARGFSAQKEPSKNGNRRR